MSLVMRLLPDNPVLTKEMRVRMRGAKAYWILFGYLGFLSLVMLSVYGVWMRNVAAAGVGASSVGMIGASLFASIVSTQVFLALFITPAITSGSLTIEKEQRTLEMLTMTGLSSRSVVVGKLMAAVSFTALMLLTTLPLMSVCFMLGGVDPAMVASEYLMLLMGSFLIGALGLMWSSIAKNTTQAVLFTYMTLFFLFVAGGVAFSAAHSPFSGGGIGENAVRAFGASWFGDSFLGLPVIEGVGFAIFCGLGGILMAAVAMSRLEMWPERKGGLLRGLTALIVGVQLLAVYQWWLNAWFSRTAQAVQTQVQTPISSLTILGALLMFLTPIFATGELTLRESRQLGRTLRGGWSRRGLGRGKLASGLPFLLLMTLGGLGLYVASFALVGQGRHAFEGVRGKADTPMQSPLFTPLTADKTVGFNGLAYPSASEDAIVGKTDNIIYNEPRWVLLRSATALLSFVVGMGLFCLLLSVVLRNRWMAWLTACLFLAVIWIAPEMGKTPLAKSQPAGYSVNFLYLNTVQALYQISDQAAFSSLARELPMAYQPMWLYSSFAWLLVGAASLALMRFILRRDPRLRQDTPYEELTLER